jgi:hypothetical protein
MAPAGALPPNGRAVTTHRERKLARARQRRYRRREREALLQVKVEVSRSIVDRLIEDGFLDDVDLSDPQSIDQAVPAPVRPRLLCETKGW